MRLGGASGMGGGAGSGSSRHDDPPGAVPAHGLQRSRVEMPLYGMEGFTGVASQVPAVPVESTVRLAAPGDEVAFGHIVTACHADMLRVSYAVCSDLDMARDAVQSAWLIAWRKLRTLRDPDRVRPWLVAVAANETRHLLRRHHPVYVDELACEPSSESYPDPADRVRQVDLANALHHLTPDERTLLALRFVAGFDSSEIGQALGLTASGARARLARTISRLRKELGDA